MRGALGLGLGLGLGLVCACGDDGWHAQLSTSGTAGVPAPAAVTSNLLFTEVAANGHGGVKMLVDTGAPLTLIDPTSFGLPAPTSYDPQLATLTVGGIVYQHPATLASTVKSGSLPFAFGGILGANLVCKYPTTFDYRGGSVRLGAAGDPGDLAAPINVPFRLSGGGVVSLGGGRTLPYPPTRIPIDVALDGTTYHLIADTGASEVTLRGAAFDALTADGRATLTGVPLGTVGGQQLARATRLQTVGLAGAMVTTVAALALPDETLFDNIGREIGHHVDGVLGGDFWREFYLTVDYPAGVLRLRRYPSRDHIRDEFTRVGLLLQDVAGGAPHQYTVLTVFAGTDAALQGFAADDPIASIDGVDLSTVDAVTADTMLIGAAGDTRRLARDGSAGIAVRIEDLLPVKR